MDSRLRGAAPCLEGGDQTVQGEKQTIVALGQIGAGQLGRPAPLPMEPPATVAMVQVGLSPGQVFCLRKQGLGPALQNSQRLGLGVPILH